MENERKHPYLAHLFQLCIEGLAAYLTDADEVTLHMWLYRGTEIHVL